MTIAGQILVTVWPSLAPCFIFCLPSTFSNALLRIPLPICHSGLTYFLFQLIANCF